MTIFCASPVLIALNCGDPATRRERIEALAGLVEDFEVQLDFDADLFVGVIDVMAPPMVTAAVA
jgi:hypothetical protein